MVSKPRERVCLRSATAVPRYVPLILPGKALYATTVNQYTAVVLLARPRFDFAKRYTLGVPEVADRHMNSKVSTSLQTSCRYLT